MIANIGTRKTPICTNLMLASQCVHHPASHSLHLSEMSSQGGKNASTVIPWCLLATFVVCNHLQYQYQEMQIKRKDEQIQTLQTRSAATVVDGLQLERLNDSALRSLGKILSKKALEVTVEITKRTFSEQNTCVVCQDSKKTHTFLPCGHRCVCGSCALQIFQRTRRCPICRKHAQQAIEVYV